jgi:cytochrome c biogenesis protein CcmG, thiol:disulfide interchange protein DsbE
MATGFVHGAVEIARLVDGVSIGEKEPAATGFASGGPDGVVLARPAFLQLGGREKSDASEAAGNFGGEVGGLVIHYDEFPITAELEDLFRLGYERFEAGRKIQLLVAGGDDDCEFDELFWFWLIEYCPCTHENGKRFAGLVGQAEDGFECSAMRFGCIQFVCHSALAFQSVPAATYYKDVRFTGFVASGSLLALALTCGCDRGARPANADKVAPDFTVSDGENTIHLADYRGKVVLLNFWWSQCPPCIQETPALEQLHRDRPDLAILAVSIDSDPGSYRRFINRYHVDVSTVRDPDQTVAKMYGTEGWPETYIIDRKGVIRRKIVGDPDWSNPEIRNYLNSL